MGERYVSLLPKDFLFDVTVHSFFRHLLFRISQPKHIEYSHKYADDDYEYRHVILTQVIHESLPKDLKVRYERTLTDREWRELGVQQSLGWVHYMWHKPEPHILLFRRRLGTVYHRCDFKNLTQDVPTVYICHDNLRIIRRRSIIAQYFSFISGPSHWSHRPAAEAGNEGSVRERNGSVHETLNGENTHSCVY